MEPIFRSTREATGFLIEQMIPGDFVRVASQGGTAPIYGRVLAPEDPVLAQLPSNPGRSYIQVGENDFQEFDPADLEKVNAVEIPPDVVTVISGKEDQVLAMEVLNNLTPELAEEFGLGRELGGHGPRPGVAARQVGDPARSSAAKQSQNNPDTRRKKSKAMRHNWRRTKSRSGNTNVLGNEPSALRHEQLGTFESLIEQELDQMAGPSVGDNAQGIDGQEAFADEPNKFTDTNAVDPRVAYNMTMRVFEATNDIMKTLALAKGMPYYMWLQDDPEEGTVRLKVNGTCPREIMERFIRDLEDIELVLLEKPEGDEDDRNVIGNWVFETKLPGFPDEYEDPDYQPEVTQPAQQGEFPGEVVLPEEPSGAAMGV